ncbi:MAG: 30S ribosome-binding factor RbfA [Verrucomicrobiota bacterium]
MSTRILRVNELIHREIGAVLRKRYQSEAVTITITGVEVTPDLQHGKVFVSVTGDDDHVAERFNWLRHHAKEIRHELARNLVLKQMPLLTYHIDTSTERGNRVLGLLDELTAQEKAKPADDGV